MAILTAQNATKRFGGLVALDELDLEVKEHTIHSIIGANGAGPDGEPAASLNG